MKIIKHGSANALSRLKRSASNSLVVDSGQKEAVCLVIDRSASMGCINGTMTRLAATKKAIGGFLDVCIPARSRVAATSFSDRPRVEFPMSNKYATIRAAVDGICLDGSTHISEALGMATDLSMIQSVGIHRLIVLSDGCASDADVALSWARNGRPKEVVIDTIYFGDKEDDREYGDYGYISGYKLMVELAEISGGVFTLAKDANELFQTFKQLEVGARGLLTAGTGAA